MDRIQTFWRTPANNYLSDGKSGLNQCLPVPKKFASSLSGIPNTSAIQEGIEIGWDWAQKNHHLHIPYHLRISSALAANFESDPLVRPWVITLVREPIGREISNFFHNIETAHPGFDYEKGRIDASEILQILKHGGAKPTLGWFDYEFKKALSIDVYKYPFDIDKGFTIIREPTAQILILRLESLNDCFDEAIMNFFRFETAAPC